MGRKRIRGLKARVGGSCISAGGQPDCTVKVYKPEESEEEVTVLVGVVSPEEAGTQQGGQLQE